MITFVSQMIIGVNRSFVLRNNLERVANLGEYVFDSYISFGDYFCNLPCIILNRS